MSEKDIRLFTIVYEFLNSNGVSVMDLVDTKMPCVYFFLN